MTDHYAVVGNPIAHSKSPFIHTLFAAQTHQDMHYEARLLPLDDVADSLSRLYQQGLKGLNVTVPFKFDAFTACHEITPRARMAGAVNTLIRTEQGWKGDNTDGAGLVADLTKQYGDLSGKHILMLGAGGAASGVTMPLLEARVDQLTIANRSPEKASLLANKMQHVRVNGCSYDAVPDQAYDIVINATAASLAGELPPLKAGWFNDQTLAYDMMYANQPTVFMQHAQQLGANRCIDGLGMLVEQAAEAFYIWRGIRPDTDAVRIALAAGSE